MKKLIVYAKEPVPGKVKTRLSPPLSMKEAAQVYQEFLQVIAKKLVKINVDQ